VTAGKLLTAGIPFLAGYTSEAGVNIGLINDKEDGPLNCLNSPSWSEVTIINPTATTVSVYSTGPLNIVTGYSPNFVETTSIVDFDLISTSVFPQATPCIEIVNVQYVGPTSFQYTLSDPPLQIDVGHF